VCDEAQYALERGILVPVLLDDTKPPLGFREIKFVSLANPATADKEMERIISSIRKLSKADVGVDVKETIDSGAQITRYGVRGADEFLKGIRDCSNVLRQNPGSERALRDALRGVHQTYEVVIDAIDQFLSPLTKKLQMELALYLPIASGRMVQEIQLRRGHCEQITRIYWAFRESLPATVTDAAKNTLDKLIESLKGGDLEVFQSMTAVGSALAKEGAVITNFLLAEQPQAANVHLRQCASKLLPLQQELTQGMGRVDKLIVDLGIDISNAS
jgi:hypothetical protein